MRSLLVLIFLIGCAEYSLDTDEIEHGLPGGGPDLMAVEPDDAGACLLLPEPYRTWCFESPTPPPPPPRRYFPEPIPPPWVTP